MVKNRDQQVKKKKKKSTNTQTISFDKHLKNTTLFIMVMRRIDIHMQKDATGPLLHIIHKNPFTMD